MDGTLQIKPENLLNLGKYYVGTVQFQLSLTVRNIPTMLCLGAKLFLIVIHCAKFVLPGVFLKFQQKGLHRREEQVLQYLATNGLGGRKVRL